MTDYKVLQIINLNMEFEIEEIVNAIEKTNNASVQEILNYMLDKRETTNKHKIDGSNFNIYSKDNPILFNLFINTIISNYKTILFNIFHQMVNNNKKYIMILTILF